ncbi:hypothetical protein [Enterococcus sp. LJL90]
MIAFSFYLYQFPFKKYIAVQKFYPMIEKMGVPREKVVITKSLRDYNSQSDGVTIFFNVSNSSFDYQYDYLIKKEIWIRGYVEDGIRINTDEIIFKK